MNNRGYKQLYLRRTQIDNLIFMQNMTTQCHSKKYTVQSNTASQKIKVNCIVLQRQFTKRGYDSSSIETEIKNIELLDKKDSLTPKTKQKAHVLPLTVIYNRTLHNIKQIIRNH